MELIKTNERFYLDDNGIVAAEMTFSHAGETMIIIDHTLVNENYNGQGLGKQLLNEVVNYARANNVKIIPLCPFAKAQFEKNKEIQDVLKT